MLPHFEVQQVGNEIAVHDKRTGSVHLLNDTGAEIWRLALDGSNASEIMETLISRHPDASAAIIGQDVQQTLQMLRQVGLLPQETSTEPHR